jgi:hypothetical protein
MYDYKMAQIINQNNKVASVKEIMFGLGFKERNMVAPRITELKQAQIIKKW